MLHDPLDKALTERYRTPMAKINPPGTHPVFDLSRGIEGILPFEGASSSSPSGAAQGATPTSCSLAGLYHADNWESAMDAYLRPALRNPADLAPAAYRAALDGCLEELSAHKDPAVQALCALLRAEQENAALLDAMRGILISG